MVLAAAIMLVGMTGILEHNLELVAPRWNTGKSSVSRSLQPNPIKPPVGAFEGVFLFENGFAECVNAPR